MATEYHGHVEPPDPVKRAAARRGEGTRKGGESVDERSPDRGYRCPPRDRLLVRRCWCF